ELRAYLLDELPPLEAQLIDLADEIAYLTADMDDGVEAEILSPGDLCRNVSLVEEFYRKMEIRYPDTAPKLLFHEALKRMLNALVNDLVVNTHRRVMEGEIDSLVAVRHAGRRLAAFSEEMEQRRHQAKQYLLQELYHAHYLERDHALAEEIIAGLFQHWIRHPLELPMHHETQIASEGAPRVIADYIAGMTDHFISEQWGHVQASRKK
ncbi:MAG: deoxyguanosinetriphosphate triphosphohydrolase, partial [Acidobacteriaceae bacterium]